jgi:hypothetical protein
MTHIPNSREMVFETDMLSRYALRVDSSTTRKEILAVGFWKNCGPRLKVGDIVEVFDIGFSIDMSLRVMSVFNGKPTFRILREFLDDASAEKAGALADMSTSYSEALGNGDTFYWRETPNGTFSVVNVFSREPLETGLTKQQAVTKCSEWNAKAGKSAVA